MKFQKRRPLDIVAHGHATDKGICSVPTRDRTIFELPPELSLPSRRHEVIILPTEMTEAIGLLQKGDRTEVYLSNEVFRNVAV